MRYLYAACLGLLAYTAQGQVVAPDSAREAIVRDERWVRSQVDSVGECTEILCWGGPGGLVRVYHPSGRLKEYRPYANLATGQMHGVATSWYDDGQLAVYQAFLRGRRDGALVAYYPDGQLKRETKYVDGNELPGRCFDPSGMPVAFFPYERPPLYPGGQLQLIKEIMNRVRKWQSGGSLVISEAQIHISFQIEEHGRVENPQVTITNEHFTLVRYPYSVASQSLQATLAAGSAPLVSCVQQGLISLAKPFYPGQRDGATVRWQYSLIIPYSYGAPLLSR